MQQKFNTIGLVIRQDMQSHLDTVRLVTKALGKHANLLVHSLDADFSIAPIQTVAMTKLVEQCDLVITLGGDGTYMTAGRA